MPRPSDLVLAAAEMRAAEEALIAEGVSVDELMQRAGRGAAEWVWRVAAGRPVTVLCGPGNNGGDGYVIAEALRQRGGTVAVMASAEPKTEAAQNARALYRGEVLGPEADPQGAVLVDCLFGTGLTRSLAGPDLALLQRLAVSHSYRIAVDLPSGVSGDDAALLNEGLPDFDLTLALGAWKWAHWMLPAAAKSGALRLIEIGVDTAAQRNFTVPSVLQRPRLSRPAASANKYSRGMVGIVVGEMPGAAILAAQGAKASGAGYVKLLSDGVAISAPAELVVDQRPLRESLDDMRINAILIGPGLGRDEQALERFESVCRTHVDVAHVIDADALHLLRRVHDYDDFTEHARAKPTTGLGFSIDDALWRRQRVLTPHQGELDALDQIFGLPVYHPPFARKVHQAIELDWVQNAAVVAKGADTFIFHRDLGARVVPLSSGWLSTAGTGDVLAGLIAGRLATGSNCLEAACEGVWLHGEAARLAGPVFTASQLAKQIPNAFSACL